MRHELELAWAAGFFDGEGSFTAARRGNATDALPRGYLAVVASIGQTDRDVLERFQRAVGLGSIHGPYRNGGRKSQPHWSQVYRWSSNGRDTAEVFRLLQPYLSRPKTEQYEERLLEVTTYRQEHRLAA